MVYLDNAVPLSNLPIHRSDLKRVQNQSTNIAQVAFMKEKLAMRRTEHPQNQIIQFQILSTVSKMQGK